MKTKTIYEAEDGSRFESKKACEEYEGELRKYQKAMLPLEPRPELSGEQYFQHDREICLKAKRDVIALAKNTVKDKIWDNPPDEIHPMSFAGRLIDDCGHAALRHAWGRFCSIDFSTGREYQQPYFTLHPEEATERINHK